MTEASIFELWDAAPCAFVVTNEALVIMRVNNKWITWLGFTQSGMVTGVRFTQFLTPASRIYVETLVIPKLQLGAEFREIAVEIQVPNAAPLPVFMTIRKNAEGTTSTPTISMVLIDATERRRYENEILQATRALQNSINQRNRLLGIIAHDLRSPLSGMIGALELIKIEPESQSNQENIEYALSTGDRMLRLICDLLDANAAEAGHLRIEKLLGDVTVALRAAVVEARINAARKSSQVLWHEAKTPLYCHHDAIRITQAVGNLLNNAIKFSPRASTIELRTGADEKYFILTISDQGPGIPIDEIPNLFKAFSTGSAKPTGGEVSTGLGLSIVHQIVNAHAGTIQVESPSGGGSHFRIFLPRE